MSRKRQVEHRPKPEKPLLCNCGTHCRNPREMRKHLEKKNAAAREIWIDRSLSLPFKH